MNDLKVEVRISNASIDKSVDSFATVQGDPHAVSDFNQSKRGTYGLALVALNCAITALAFSGIARQLSISEKVSMLKA